jgi:predicted DCC family thiol-disulfide oxidoreductase YuxK
VFHFVGNDDDDNVPKDVPRDLLDRTAVVIDTRGRWFIEARAVFEILRVLPVVGVFAWPLRLPGISQLATLGYRAFAARRLDVSAWLGLGVCGVPDESRMQHRAEAKDSASTGGFRALGASLAVQVREVLACLFIFVFAGMLMNDNPWARRQYRYKPPAWVTNVANYGRYFQGWGMFAPEPPFDDGRVVVDGRTRDGRKLDPLTGQAPDFDPHTEVGWGHDQFWCDYHNRIRFSGSKGYRPHFEEYLKRQHLWSGQPNDQLVAFDVWWVRDRSPKPGQLKGKPLRPEKIMSWGTVRDSLATPWLNPSAAHRTRRGQRRIAPGPQAQP